MALTKVVEADKIEVVNTWTIQVRNSTIIKEDGVEISRSYHRDALNPGTLDASDNLVATDISKQPANVQAHCNAAWTDTVKNNFKEYLINIEKNTPKRS